MRAVLIAIVCAFISTGVHATVLVPAGVDELAHDAVAIARGRVVAVDAQWTDNRRSIETIVSLQTETYLKGSLGDVVRFRVPGGSMGRFSRLVMGAPRFAVGQRVIVFLGSRGPTIPYVLGLSEGVFRVVQSPQGDWRVTPPMLPDVDGPIVRGSRALKPSSLAEFEQQVRALVGRAQ